MSVDPSTPPVPAPLPAAPTPSERPSRRSAVGLYVAMLVTLILLRGLTASPGDRVPVRNMDEQLMFAVGISSITGGPANTLGWPGGSMRLATTFLTPAVFAFEHHDAILHRRRDVPVKFVQFLGRELREPWRMVGLLRWTTIVLSSVGFAFLPLILRRLTSSNGVAFAISLIALCGGTMWVRSLMATGDAVGWAMVVVGLWAAIRSRESVDRWAAWAFVAALCAGLATASKLTSIYCWPLLFIACVRSRRTLAAAVLIWLTALPLGHYLLNPYVATDAVRFAKAVAGNLITRAANTPLSESILQGVPIGLTIAGLLSIPFALTRRRVWVVFATIGTFAMYAITIRRAAMIEPHYLTPLAIPLAMLATIGIDWLARRPSIGRRPILITGTLALAAVVSIGFGWRATRQASDAAAAKYGVGLAAVRHLESIGFNGRIAVQPSQSYHDLFLAKIERDESVAARLARMEQQIAAGKSVVATLGKSGFDPRVAAGLADAFNDSDRMKIANYRSMSVAGVTSGAFVVPVRASNAQPSDPSMSVTEAIDAFRRGDVDAVLLADPIDGLEPTRDFGGAAGERSVLYIRDRALTPTTQDATTNVSNSDGFKP